MSLSSVAQKDAAAPVHKGRGVRGPRGAEMPTPEAAGSGVSEAPVLTLKGATSLPPFPASSHSPTSQRARQALVSIDLSLSPVPFCGEFHDTRG